MSDDTEEYVPDFILPQDVDWTTVDIEALLESAQDGILGAQQEVSRRLEETE